MNGVAKDFSTVIKGCESGWTKLWHGIEDAVKDILDIAKYMCQYLPEIMEGTALAGEEEAEPIEGVLEGVCKAYEFIEEAIAVVKAVDDAAACAELTYGVTQFVLYSKDQS